MNIKKDIRQFLYAQSRANGKVTSERKIAELFNIKRSVARDVLLELVGEGIIECRPRSGYRYVDYTVSPSTSITFLRYNVEMEAVSLALKNATSQDDENLKACCKVLDEAVLEEDNKKFQEADCIFHANLVKASHDNTLIKINEFIQTAIFKQAYVPFSGLSKLTQVAHKNILQAFLDRDEEKLLNYMKRHLKYQDIKDKLNKFAKKISVEQNDLALDEFYNPIDKK